LLVVYPEAISMSLLGLNALFGPRSADAGPRADLHLITTADPGPTAADAEDGCGDGLGRDGELDEVAEQLVRDRFAVLQERAHPPIAGELTFEG
jgi:hypothetical protein